MHSDALRPVLIAFASVFAACTASIAHAGIFRAYLSLSGNDANPCTVQQPCRLLPAALAAVNDGGEVWMLDSANYNTTTVSITRSVSILAVPGVVGSVVANGGDAITINAAASNIALRNLTVRPLSGSGTGNGMTIAAVGSLSIDNMVFENLNDAVSLSGAAKISIRESVFRHNFSGLSVSQSGGAQETIAVDHASYIENSVAFSVLANSTSGFVRVTIDDSLIRGGGNGNGAAAFGGGVASAAPVIVTIMRTKVIGDANGNGISSFGTQTVVTLADCHVSGWAIGGTRTLNGVSGVGTIQSLGNNLFVDNGGAEISAKITPQ
ncbi:MAG TPA: hypothetical protein VFQ93_00005 [Casimicrobiaceae bacterium]|jgi:hypothetical protein|nr:hypothetical protein [Casimicrobiaceae bacterium]